MKFKPRRFKSIDIFRGMCMAWMFLGHLLDWWLKPEFFLIRNSAHMLLDSIGASGFLFISGVSITLSYRNQMYRVEKLKRVSYFRIRLSYFIRSLLLLLIALLYNLTIAISISDLSWIWSWFILMTAAFSLMVMWPLFKTPKLFRILLAFFLWFLSAYLYSILSPYQGNTNFLDIFYHILFNPFDQDPFINFFSFFLFGTIFGEILSSSNFEADNEKLKRYLNNHIIKPSLLIGPLLIFTGVVLTFPNFLVRSSLSWLIYTLGINITLIVILIFFEENGFFNTKKSYRFLFYYSYYSFTVYLGHHLLFFVCINCFNAVSIWIVVILTFILFELILKHIYKLWGWKASIKSIIGRLSAYLAKRIELNRR
jgi:uncharacterized membrane protein